MSASTRTMPLAGAFAIASLAIAAVACGGSSPTSPQPAAPSGLRIVADPVIDLTPGESRTLQLQHAGAAVSAAGFSWTTSDDAIVAIEGAGVVRARALGQAVVTARAADGQTADLRVWVQPPSQAPSTYTITLVFGDNVPASWHEIFEWARDRWQQVIRAELPATTLANPPANVCGTSAGAPPIPTLSGVTTGSTILIERSVISATAAGGPCTQRPWPAPTTIFGRVTVGTPSTDPLPSTARSMALHEIGHALGLVAIVQGAPPPWYEIASQRYTGPLALEGYRRQFGNAVEALTLFAGHWNFSDDVMSHNWNSVRITKATVGALMDLGYPAAWYAADTW